MGLRPTKGHEDAVGRFRGLNDLCRFFNGADGPAESAIPPLRPRFGAFSDLSPLLANDALLDCYERKELTILFSLKGVLAIRIQGECLR